MLIAGVLFYADWKLGWDATKAYTAPACIAYFALNGALTYWIWAVEKGSVFVGVNEGGEKVRFLLGLHTFSRRAELQIKSRANAMGGQIY